MADDKPHRLPQYFGVTNTAQLVGVIVCSGALIVLGSGLGGLTGLGIVTGLLLGASLLLHLAYRR